MTIPPPPHQADMNNESLGRQNKSDSVHAGTGEGQVGQAGGQDSTDAWDFRYNYFARGSSHLGQHGIKLCFHLDK